MASVALSDKRRMADTILAEETGRFVRRLKAALPKEIFARLEAEGLEERLHNCLERNFRGIFSRYLETADGRKIRNCAESDEAGEGVARGVSRRTPDEVAELLNAYGIEDRVSSGDIESSPVLEAGGGRDMEIYTNSILRQKTDAGAFLTSENTCEVVKCAFRDNALKPKNVTDVKLCVNIPDAVLVDPAFRYHAAVRYLACDLVAAHFAAVIESEIEALGPPEGIDGGALIERIIDLGSRQDSADFDMAGICKSISSSSGIESIYAQGYAAAVNTITSTLDAARMSYQFLENCQNSRTTVIREYGDDDPAGLPDEHYRISFRLLDDSRLAGECGAYDAEIKAFEDKVGHLWELVDVIYQDSKSVFKVNDFDDLAKKNKNRLKKLPLEWGDISFQHRKESVRARLARMHERITNMYEFLYPIERRVMEERLAVLEAEYARLDYMANPHLLQSGLVLDVDLTSIKRKKTTLDSMAIVLAEFLRTAPSAFHDAALSV